jgi:hypothetical protein
VATEDDDERGEQVAEGDDGLKDDELGMNKPHNGAPRCPRSQQSQANDEPPRDRTTNKEEAGTEKSITKLKRKQAK